MLPWLVCLNKNVTLIHAGYDKISLRLNTAIEAHTMMKICPININRLRRMAGQFSKLPLMVLLLASVLM